MNTIFNVKCISKKTFYFKKYQFIKSSQFKFRKCPLCTKRTIVISKTTILIQKNQLYFKRNEIRLIILEYQKIFPHLRNTTFAKNRNTITMTTSPLSFSFSFNS